MIRREDCDKKNIATVVGLRYGTTPEQIRRVLAKMRQVCLAHPMIEARLFQARLKDDSAQEALPPRR